MMREKLLLFEPDMLFSSKIESAATRSGLEVNVAVTVGELQRALTEFVPKMTLVNLDVLGTVGLSILQRFAGACKLVGYYSHADSALAAQALASGFQTVVPRRSFVDQLPKILVDISG